MAGEADIRLRLSAQAALLGVVTPNLRSFSVELKGGVIRTLAVFAFHPSDEEREGMQLAATEIIGDFYDEKLDETILVSSDTPSPRLELAVYERYEPPGLT